MLSDHGCVQLLSFLPTAGWSNDPRNLDLQYTPAEYGLQEGDSVYFYSALIPEEQFPRRLICLSDYITEGLQASRVELDGETVERNVLRLKLCPLEITGTFGVVVLKDQPNREPPKLPESVETAQDTSNQKKGGKQQGKKAPPKEAPKTAPAKTGGKGRSRGPPGKPLKLKLSSFEPIKTLKDLILSQLGDHLQSEAAIELNPLTHVLTCDIYVNNIFQQDCVPLYASSLYPPFTPAVIKVHPRSILHYSNLTNLFDFWTTLNYIEMKLEENEDLSNIQKAEFMNDDTAECSQKANPQDPGGAQGFPCENISNHHTLQASEVLNMTSANTTVVTENEANTIQIINDVNRDTTDVTNNLAEVNNETNSNQADCDSNGNGAVKTTEVDTNAVVVATDEKSVEADKENDKTKKLAADANSHQEDTTTDIPKNEIMVETEKNDTVNKESDVAENNQESAESTSVEAPAVVPLDQSQETTDNGLTLAEVKQSTDEKIEQRKRNHFLAWYDHWKVGMLWWGMETLRRHTSYLRWINTDQVSQMDKTKGLENGAKAVNLLAQEYRDSVDPVVEEKHYYAGDCVEVIWLIKIISVIFIISR